MKECNMSAAYGGSLQLIEVIDFWGCKRTANWSNSLRVVASRNPSGSMHRRKFDSLLLFGRLKPAATEMRLFAHSCISSSDSIGPQPQ